LSNILAKLYVAAATMPLWSKKHKVAEPAHVSHDRWMEYLPNTFNKKGLRILEIGSRNVTGINMRQKFCDADYVGFDFYAGENVDVVGDAHKISQYFDKDNKFDLIFSSAVFEHLYMPWVVAPEIQKLLKVGGHVFIETHFSFSSHERPWHFFQFSDMGLKALFDEALGFEVIECGMSNPMYGFFSKYADKYLRFREISELYCHSEIYCRKVREVDNFDWSMVSADVVSGGTNYPEPI